MMISFHLFSRYYSRRRVRSRTMADESKRVFHEVIAHATEVLFGLSIFGAFCTILTFMVFSRIRTVR